MSASLVRKALDETVFASKEKLDQLSKSSQKGFKPQKKKKKVSKDKILKQNLKILKSLEYRTRHKPGIINPSDSAVSGGQAQAAGGKVKSKKSKKNKKEEEESVGFTDEDFQKFEKEYFVTH